MNKSDYLYKILAVERILQDNPSGVTTKQIIDKLDNLYGIKAERKSIYGNIAVLTRFLNVQRKKNVYYIEK